MSGYKETTAFLDSLVNYEKLKDYDYKKSMKLNRMKKFLKLLGNPQGSFRSIHIAGTKGKGSTSAMLYYVLKEKGLKVGLYTSPHLIDWRERVRISPKSKVQSPKLNNEEELISEEELCELVNEIRQKVNEFNRDTNLGVLTFFEVFTAIAFLYFARNKIDIAILETGLGGRCDATNVVEAVIACITSISFDHTRLLGPTLRDIAKEKAGIIKKNCQVISSPQNPAALAVIEEVCKSKGARLYRQGKDFKVSLSKQSPFSKNHRLQRFDVSGIFGRYENIHMPLIGGYQAENAATAICALEILRDYGIHLTDDDIHQGFSKISWPGRFEIVKENPCVVLDGAHNKASAAALAKVVKETFPHRNCILILGVCKDKDIKGMAIALCPLASHIILTKADNPRALKPSALLELLRDIHPKITETEDIKEAINYARRLATAEDLILITGSLYLVGEARRLLV